MKYELIDGISIPIAESFRDVMTLRESDATRYGLKTSWVSMWVTHLQKPIYAFLWYLRLSQYEKSRFLSLYARVRLRRYIYKYGLQIPYTVKIGYGLYIGHGFGTIVSEKTVIGNNVNLSQFTTIGATESGAPVIGDTVYIGPSVCVIGHVYIGKDSTVGAGAVVTKDVPENVTVAGVPARIIQGQGHKEYVNRKYYAK